MARRRRRNNLPKNKDSLDNPEYLWYRSPVRFSSITSVINFIKDKTKDKPQLRSRALKNFEKFSQKITVGTRSFQRIDKKRQYHYNFGSKNYLFQMDIADLFGDNRDRISKLNNSAKYILIIVNCLTKRVYAYPLLNRKNPTIINVLKQAFKEIGLKQCEDKKHFLTNFQVDKEFIVGIELQDFFKDYCLNVYYTQSIFKASMAERFIKYCKEKLASRMEALRTEKWIPLLKDIVLQYNTTRKHTTTNLTPMEAEKYPSAALIRILEKNYKKSIKYPPKKSYKFKVGQSVRLLHKGKEQFRKNYQRRFTANTFIIYRRRRVNYVNIYYLKNRKGEELKGSFREDELRLANTTDEVYPYTIIKTKDNLSLVHYDGFPASEDEWIENKELNRRTEK